LFFSNRFGGGGVLARVKSLFHVIVDLDDVFFSGGTADDEGFGGTSTLGVIGIEVGDGLDFFLGLALATLLHVK
jgi:hypothetical protein